MVKYRPSKISGGNISDAKSFCKCQNHRPYNFTKLCTGMQIRQTEQFFIPVCGKSIKTQNFSCVTQDTTIWPPFFISQKFGVSSFRLWKRICISSRSYLPQPHHTFAAAAIRRCTLAGLGQSCIPQSKNHLSSVSGINIEGRIYRIFLSKLKCGWQSKT